MSHLARYHKYGGVQLSAPGSCTREGTDSVAVILFFLLLLMNSKTFLFTQCFNFFIENLHGLQSNQNKNFNHPFLCRRAKLLQSVLLKSLTPFFTLHKLVHTLIFPKFPALTLRLAEHRTEHAKAEKASCICSSVRLIGVVSELNL